MSHDWLLAFVDRDFAVAFADVAPVGVCHFARTVDDAAHYGDDHAFEVFCTAFYFFECAFEVVHRAAATRAGDVFRSVETSAGSLHEFICDVAQEVGGKQKLTFVASLCYY